MNFQEETSGSESLCCLCHHGHIATVATRFAVGSAWLLNAVGAVHDDIIHNLQHLGDVSEVNHQVVVTHHVAALCQPDLFGTSLAGFLYGIAHILSAEKLGLLDVYDTTGLGCCNEQIGLSAQEGWYLQHVAHLSCRLCLPGFVNVCCHA